MKIDVMKLGNPTKTVSVSSGSTVGDVVDASGYATRGCNLVRDGRAVSRGDAVYDGETINIVANVKGGAGQVTLTRLGQGEVSHALSGTETLSEFLRRVGVSTRDCGTYLNGKAATGSTTLRDGDRVTVAPQVEGGN